VSQFDGGAGETSLGGWRGGSGSSSLDLFSPAVRAWFEASFPAPTAAQTQGWPAIAGGEHTLILAPTGSGKTLAAFLWGIDRLISAPLNDNDDDNGSGRGEQTRIVYVSPLRALAVDVEKNLQAPLAGIRSAAERLGVPLRAPTVGLRTGDTAADERRRLVRHPPDILVTTPESLYLMLTSQARSSLRGVEAVIVDEIHSLVPTKRGTHLALTMERLDAWAERPVQRIGLSATQRPLDLVAQFLGGYDNSGDGRVRRPVTVVDAGVRKQMDIEVVVPVDFNPSARAGPGDSEPSAGRSVSIWPAIHPRLVELVEAHRSTLIFVNARRLAERLAARLNELWAEGRNRAAEAEGRSLPEGSAELVKAHHGSLSRERRLQIEDELKTGRLRGLVATSSLELGIDMGAVDLVVQVESPGAVSRGLQRIGRAGHQVGEPSRGKLFPKHRHDLLEAAVVTQRMQDGLIEATRYPRNPVDVLCQQIVAMVALDEWKVDELAALVRRAAPYADLSDDALEAVLDLLSGRYPSDEFAGLRPRLVWDRTGDILRARAGAQRLAVTNPGTIPDRGLFGVFLPGGTRVGELDEEMVYESRPGETFLLGATTWRIEEITHDRVVVTPAPGAPGKMPFWHGDGPGRPLELGQALGAFTRELRSLPMAAAVERLRTVHRLDERAAANVLTYLDEQAEATGAMPDDRTIVVERFRDEIGDWRVCVLSPFGAQVHAPWAMALQHRLTERWGREVELMWSDDGIVLRLPEAVEQLPLDDLAIDADEIDDLVLAQLPGTALFASRFREAAARALLLPRRRPDRRTPLWQQRQRSADLLAVAGRYPSFPLLLEVTRECLNDVFDLPALRAVLRDIGLREVRLVGVDTPQASPFAQSLLFGWVAVYMYEGDAPLAERRAAALALDRELLADLLGAEELRELLDAGALADLELELQCLTDGRRARDVDELHDLLRQLGPLTTAEINARCQPGALTEDEIDAWSRPGAASEAAVARAAGSSTEPEHEPGRDASARVATWAEQLVGERRAFWAEIAGERHLAAAEDAARLRDGLGIVAPGELPTAFAEPVAAPLVDLVGRYARTHGPFLAADVVVRLGLPVEPVVRALGRLETEGRVVTGEFRPGGVQREHCDAGVLRQLRRRSLAKLRHEVEPVDGATYARFLQRWHGVDSSRSGVDALVDAVAQIQGAALPASVVEAEILPSRLADYRSADLDQLCTSGDVVWVGAGAIGSNDGRVRLVFRDQAGLLLPPPEDAADLPNEPLHQALLGWLGQHGASFWSDLVVAAQRADQPYDDPTVLAALWDLVWAGLVTNDGLAPLRAFAAGGGRAGARRTAGRRRGARRPLSRVGPPSGAGRWSLVGPLLEPVPSPTEAAHARAAQLLERHGVLTREGALAEGVDGGFAGIYPVLRALEERGRARRGYFVAGLGAAQFALPGAVDRLRSARPPVSRPGHGSASSSGSGECVVLAATDPAQPYGAALAWPESSGRPARVAGALVVLWAGEPVCFVERGGASLWTFPASATPAAVDAVAAALAERVSRGRIRQHEVRTIDGQPVRTSAWAGMLRDAGFVDGYRGLVIRG
jgi:ATP-dependent Lhr-like helicase